MDGLQTAGGWCRDPWGRQVNKQNNVPSAGNLPAHSVASARTGQSVPWDVGNWWRVWKVLALYIVTGLSSRFQRQLRLHDNVQSGT